MSIDGFSSSLIIIWIKYDSDYLNICREKNGDEDNKTNY